MIDAQKFVTEALESEVKILRQSFEDYKDIIWTRRERARLIRLLDELVDVNNLRQKLHGE